LILDFNNAGEKCSKLYCTKAEIIKAGITMGLQGELFEMPIVSNEYVF